MENLFLVTEAATSCPVRAEARTTLVVISYCPALTLIGVKKRILLTPLLSWDNEDCTEEGNFGNLSIYCTNKTLFLLECKTQLSHGLLGRLCSVLPRIPRARVANSYIRLNWGDKSSEGVSVSCGLLTRVTCFLGLAHHDVGERPLPVRVDRLDHHLVLGELLQPPDEEVEPGLVPLVTIQVKELERSLEAGSEIISERLTPLSFRARDKPAGAIYYPAIVGRNIY